MPGVGTLLGMIPWNLLIEKSPAILEGAQKLLQTVRSPARADQVTPAGHEVIPEQSFEEQMAQALREMEQSIGLLSKELVAATELIGGLAETNQGLVNRVELLRIWLTTISVGFVGSWAICLLAG